MAKLPDERETIHKVDEMFANTKWTTKDATSWPVGPVAENRSKLLPFALVTCDLGHFRPFTRRTMSTTLPRTSASMRFRSRRRLLEVLVQGRKKSVPFCRLQDPHK